MRGSYFPLLCLWSHVFGPTMCGKRGCIKRGQPAWTSTKECILYCTKKCMIADGGERSNEAKAKDVSFKLCYLLLLFVLLLLTELNSLFFHLFSTTKRSWRMPRTIPRTMPREPWHARSRKWPKRQAGCSRRWHWRCPHESWGWQDRLAFEETNRGHCPSQTQVLRTHFSNAHYQEWGLGQHNQARWWHTPNHLSKWWPHNQNAITEWLRVGVRREPLWVH